MEKIIFDDIIKTLGLGTFISRAKNISGGYMHKMYCLETTTGKYAVKLLNPIIMKREGSFKNFQIAEYFEKILQINNIPIVPALEFNGEKMQCINNQYFYIFNWIDGKSLFLEEIQKKHCKLIGEILAKIHKIEQIKEPYLKKEVMINWDLYIKLSNRKCLEIASLLNNNRELLYHLQKEGNASLQDVPNIRCICNGDMDSKNVLWIDGQPRIIDLECLSYGNPYIELFNLALHWSGYENCDINYDLIYEFINSYFVEYGKIKIDWEVLYSVNLGQLEWLEYNVKRALMIECGNEKEKLIGIEQVRKTMKCIVYYSKVRDCLINKLSKI